MSHHHHYRRSDHAAYTIVARGRNQKHEMKLIEKLVFSERNAFMCAHSLVVTGEQWQANGLRSSKNNNNGRKINSRAELVWPLTDHFFHIAHAAFYMHGNSIKNAAFFNCLISIFPHRSDANDCKNTPLKIAD